MGTTNKSDQPIVHKFGDEDLSDVTFIVGGEEFKCHRMTLASRSTYFKAMFYSNFEEKDQEKIVINANPLAFKNLMEIIYTGQFSDWKKKLDCACAKPTDRNFKGIPVWQEMTSILELADEYNMKKYVMSMVESCFIRSGECTTAGRECRTNGTKYLIALMYGMDEYIAKFSVNRSAIWAAVITIKSDYPTITLPMESLQWILKMP